MARSTVQVAGIALHDSHSRTSCMQLAVRGTDGLWCHDAGHMPGTVADNILPVPCFLFRPSAFSRGVFASQHPVISTSPCRSVDAVQETLGIHDELQPKSETSTQHHDHAAISSIMQAASAFQWSCLLARKGLTGALQGHSLSLRWPVCSGKSDSSPEMPHILHCA